jgi:hypothetical protein
MALSLPRHRPAPAFAGAGFVRAIWRHTVPFRMARTSRAMTNSGVVTMFTTTLARMGSSQAMT